MTRYGANCGPAASGGRRRNAGEATGSGRPDEAGSAVVDFVLIGALLTVIVVAVIQLALVLHVRNTLIDAAASGARYGTLADRSPQDGVERTRSLISGTLSPGFADDVSYTRMGDGAAALLQIRVTAPLPVIGLLGPSGGIEVTGHAYWPDTAD
ncbi:pilus assembly protein [Arthrobacter sp. Sa2BUA2]|uniref:Pilus assembly protein n=1 Tax=Arthrobacter pullicola TaxID=2762224 RepID=A0ABR8YJ20_9MICC|nr:TadE family protein [Arthrobacter pullicola]MBD8044223.1 pilus assembly protein [Arthrobacter pullicola]